MNVTVSFNACKKARSVICLIDKDLQTEIRSQFEQSEENADHLLERIANRMPSMLLSCLDKEDPSRPTLDQLFIALEMADTLELAIPAAVVRNRQCMQEFLDEHADDFVRERPEYTLTKTRRRDRK
jgi:hypothetical protein